MLSLISLGRSAWAKLQAAHPVIRWGGAILVALVVLEFIGDEAINLYVKMQTARYQIEQAKWQAEKTRAEYGRTLGVPTPEDQAKIRENEAAAIEREKAMPRPTCPPGQKYVGPDQGYSPGCYETIEHADATHK